MNVDEITEKIKVGCKIRYTYPEPNLNNALYHVLAIVDDYYIVVKRWSKRKKRWIYSVEYAYLYMLMYNDGHIEIEYE